MVTAPHALDAGPETVIPGIADIGMVAGGAGTLFFRLMSSRSPGRTCSGGDWEPLAVMKQNSVLPFRSTLVS